MWMIIGRPLTPLNSLKHGAGRPSACDDNSRNKVQNVRGDSSETSQVPLAEYDHMVQAFSPD